LETIHAVCPQHQQEESVEQAANDGLARAIKPGCERAQSIAHELLIPFATFPCQVWPVPFHPFEHAARRSGFLGSVVQQIKYRWQLRERPGGKSLHCTEFRNRQSRAPEFPQTYLSLPGHQRVADRADTPIKPTAAVHSRGDSCATPQYIPSATAHFAEGGRAYYLNLLRHMFPVPCHLRPLSYSLPLISSGTRFAGHSNQVRSSNVYV
jgi:hypothetical protein